MKTHEQIDQRSLLLARAVVAKMDADPQLKGWIKARQVCRRWAQKDPKPILVEWMNILENPWETIRRILLSDSAESRRLRQSNPFCGILTPRERWRIYRAFQDHETCGS